MGRRLRKKAVKEHNIIIYYVPFFTILLKTKFISGVAWHGKAYNVKLFFSLLFRRLVVRAAF